MLTRIVLAALVAADPAARAYIHFPPMTLPKLCADSRMIRVLVVKEFDRDKGVIVFEQQEVLKATKTETEGQRHLLPPDAKGAKPILAGVQKGQTAVLFTIEGRANSDQRLIACGYVFLNRDCYSVDYVPASKVWHLLRVDPEMAACYHGPAGELPALVKKVLAGDQVEVPVKKPEGKIDRNTRADEVNEVMTPLRAGKK